MDKELSALAKTLLDSLQNDSQNYLKDEVVQKQWGQKERAALQELIDAGIVEQVKAYRLVPHTEQWYAARDVSEIIKGLKSGPYFSS